MGGEAWGFDSPRLPEQDGVSRGRVLRGIAGRRFTFLRLAIKLQKKNAAVRSSFFLSFFRPVAALVKSQMWLALLSLSPLSPSAIPSRPSFDR